jgi:hypothetical protein
MSFDNGLDATSADLQLVKPWPVGSVLIEAGTFLSLSNWTWNSVPLPAAPPIACQAISQRGYDRLAQFYPYYSILSLDPSIVRRGDPRERRT